MMSASRARRWGPDVEAGAAEAGGVGDVAQGVGLLEPVRTQAPVPVALAQRLGTHQPAIHDDVGEPGEQHLRLVAEDGGGTRLDVGAPAPGPREQVVGAAEAAEPVTTDRRRDQGRETGRRCKRCHARIVVHRGQVREGVRAWDATAAGADATHG